ncbi:stage II sporulation protein P [Turicibacter sanguinis]|uniref:stage II sporulation protein P n=1 Tax=Turicibacter sanguinis TaxID=154288 RepID=UPI0012BCC237|nr:stage II sporulation protein P [Turicibacter sanguinis]MDB8567476.1 stage II sporulation protein P [Turicibacter sanguinis]MDB8570225.1 stage II sporulation protein P [Turicibacter sanguinis]MDB8572977.1 stage II sporulation protein P [Turicibacter sanguinis]MDB8581708.1 stage II sporulation protein P [Turicibacter sanguinis]MTO10285.1 stage II sporulation protein P [Turicibacter sanguinis]
MKRKRRLRSKRNKLTKQLTKGVPYLVVGFFVVTLYSTQFFQLFYVNQKEAYEKHVNQEVVLSSIFDFANPADFIELMTNLQKYFAEVMTNLDLNQLYSFLNDGFAFIQMDSKQSSVAAATPNTSNDYKYTYVSEELKLEPRPEAVNSTEPLVYLFNTHDSETYESDQVNAMLGRKVFVGDMSNLVANEFSNLGVKTLVETRDISEVLVANDWEYWQSYKASRMYLESTATEYNTLKYFIDIHRDSLNYNRTTTTIDGKSYAKLLLVVGQDHQRYKENLAFANEINNLFNMYYPGLSKGIIEKGGEYTNGIYNQDFATTLLLMEVGGVDNTYEELCNTAEAIAKVMTQYITTH